MMRLSYDHQSQSVFLQFLMGVNGHLLENWLLNEILILGFSKESVMLINATGSGFSCQNFDRKIFAYCYFY
mgnify:CR=1 FL=1